MADDLVVGREDPERVRRRIYRRAVRRIQQHARAARPGDPDRWRDTVEEIADLFGYKPWDVLAALDFALTYHPGTVLAAKARVKGAALEKRRRSAEARLHRFRRDFMGDPVPLYAAMLIVEVPTPDYEPVRMMGRPATTWPVDGFAGCMGVIFEKRWPLARLRKGTDVSPTGRVRHEDPDADPDDFAWTWARDLLRDAGGIVVPADDLRDKWGIRRRAGELPPPPNDNDPLLWIAGLEAELFTLLDPRRGRGLPVSEEELPHQRVILYLPGLPPRVVEDRYFQMLPADLRRRLHELSPTDVLRLSLPVIAEAEETDRTAPPATGTPDQP